MTGFRSFSASSRVEIWIVGDLGRHNRSVKPPRSRTQGSDSRLNRLWALEKRKNSILTYEFMDVSLSLYLIRVRVGNTARRGRNPQWGTVSKRRWGLTVNDIVREFLLETH